MLKMHVESAIHAILMVVKFNQKSTKFSVTLRFDKHTKDGVMCGLILKSKELGIEMPTQSTTLNMKSTLNSIDNNVDLDDIQDIDFLFEKDYEIIINMVDDIIIFNTISNTHEALFRPRNYQKNETFDNYELFGDLIFLGSEVKECLDVNAISVPSLLNNKRLF